MQSRITLEGRVMSGKVGLALDRERLRSTPRIGHPGRIADHQIEAAALEYFREFARKIELSAGLRLDLAGHVSAVRGRVRGAEQRVTDAQVHARRVQRQARILDEQTKRGLGDRD